MANGVPGRGHGRLVHAKRARPEAPGGADDTSDHCRRPRLDRRESSARAAGRARKVAGAGPRKARALTAAQPEASSAAPQQPRHRSREARSESAGPHAQRLCAIARPTPRCAHCTAPSTRLTSSGKGWEACGGSRQSTTRACRGALPAPPHLLLRTVADPCIEAGVPDDRRGAGLDCFCRDSTERAGAHLWPGLARRISGASAPRLERCARLEGLSPVRASERVGRGAVRAHEQENGVASVTPKSSW